MYTFDLTTLSPSNAPLVVSYSTLADEELKALLSGDQAVGAYSLAGGAADFTEGIQICLDSGICIGLLRLYDGFCYDGFCYTLDLSGDELQLIVSSDTTVVESGVTVGSGTTMQVSSGTALLNAVVSPDGAIEVFAGGAVSSAIVSSGGTMIVLDGGVAEATTLESGASMVLDGGAHLNGAIDAGGTVTTDGTIDAYGATFTFNVTNRTTEDSYILNDLAAVEGAEFSIIVGSEQAIGTYSLAGNAAGFDGTVTVYGENGAQYVELSVGTGACFGNYCYTIDVDDSGLLFLDISVNENKQSEVLLPYTMPQVNWLFGCVPTALGMLLGYYDKYGYLGYDVSDLIAGDIAIYSRYSSDKETFETVLGSFIATENYVDMFVGNTPEEELLYAFDKDGNVNTGVYDCLAAWIGTGQYWRGNDDFASTTHAGTLGDILSSTSTFTVTSGDESHTLPIRYRDYRAGLADYLATVGYSLNLEATKSISTFEDYMAEIDAGRAVIISINPLEGVIGHAMVGYGYDRYTREIIFDDTHLANQRMEWGGTYTYSGHEYKFGDVTTFVFDTTGLSQKSEGFYQIGMWSNSLEEAKAYAKEHNVPILLYYGHRATCKVCGYLEDIVFRDNMAFREYARSGSMVLLKNVVVPGIIYGGTPTCYIIDADGNVISRKDGYSYTSNWLDWLDDYVTLVDRSAYTIDLSVADMSISVSNGTSSFTIFDNILLDAVIVNSGESSIGEATAGIYIDGSLFQTIMLPGLLAGERYNINNVNLGRQGIGEHTLEIRLDYNNIWEEFDEYNNYSSCVFNIYPQSSGYTLIDYETSIINTIVSNTYVVDKGVLSILDSARAKNTIVQQGGIIKASYNGIANSTTINSGGTLAIYSHGTAILPTINSVGTALVSSMGTAISAIVSFGANLHVSDGGMAKETILAGGSVYVSSNAIVEEITVNSGLLHISQGGTALEIIEDGGCVSLDDGAYVSFISHTMSNIVLSDVATLHSGTTAISANINSNGSLHVLSSGIANETKLIYGCLYVSSGGIANHTNVPGVGYIYVYSGGTANNIDIFSNGYLFVYQEGMANSTTLQYGGSVYVESGGIINSTILLSNGKIRINGGVANSTTITKGTLTVSGGIVNDVILNSSAYLHLNGSASNVIIYSGGSLDIYGKEGNAQQITVNIGGNLYVSSGTASQIQENGGAVYIDSGAEVTFASNTLTNIVLSNHTTATLHSGTTAISAQIINSRGNLHVYSGGVASETLLAEGGNLYISNGGIANKATLNRGSIIIYGGGTLREVTANSGTLLIDNGGILDGAIVNYSGYINIQSGGSANSITLYGRLLINSGGVVSNVLQKGEKEDYRNNIFVVNNSGFAVSTTQLCGSMKIEGKAISTTQYQDGIISIGNGGIANVIIQSGGNILISENGLASDVIQHWGNIVVSGGATASEIEQHWGNIIASNNGLIYNIFQNDGTIEISSGGTASNVRQINGNLHILGGGTLHDAIISSGGTLIMSSASVLRGTLSLTNGAVFYVEQGVDLQDAEISLHVSDLKTIDNLSSFNKITLNVTTLANYGGRYCLSNDAGTFSGVVNVHSEDGETIGTLHVGESISQKSIIYSLLLDENNLFLTVRNSLAAPLISVSVSESLPTSGPVIISADIMDDTDVELLYAINEDDYVSYIGSIMLAVNGTVHFKATDRDGNVSEKDCHVSNILTDEEIAYDKETPVFITRPEVSIANNHVVWNWTATDNLGIERYVLSTRWTNYELHAGVQRYVLDLYGEENWTLTAYDFAGNQITESGHLQLPFNSDAAKFYEYWDSSTQSGLYSYALASSGLVMEDLLLTKTNNIYVSSHGVAYRNTIQDYGFINVGMQGLALSNTMNGGDMIVLSGGLASRTIVNDGSFIISGGGMTSETLQYGGRITVLSGGLANETMQHSSGEIYVKAGGIIQNATVCSGGTLVMSSASILQGTLILNEGAVFSVMQDVDAHSAEVCVNVSALHVLENLSALMGVTLCVTTQEGRGGKYCLAIEAENFTGSINIFSVGGICLGKLHIGESFEFENMKYSVFLDDGELYLYVRDMTAPPVINLKVSRELPTTKPVVITVAAMDETEFDLLYSLDGENYMPYLDTVVLSTNGVVHFKAIDIDGNVSTAAYTVSNILTPEEIAADQEVPMFIQSPVVSVDGNLVDWIWKAIDNLAVERYVLKIGELEYEYDADVQSHSAYLYGTQDWILTVYDFTGNQTVASGRLELPVPLSAVMLYSSNVLLSSGSELDNKELKSYMSMCISCWGIASNTMLTAGVIEIFNGGVANGTMQSGGCMYLSSGGIANGTTQSGGGMYLSSGGVANATTQNKGSIYIYNGGIANNTIQTGGKMCISGGVAIGTTQTNGGISVYSSGIINSTMQTGGMMYILGGIANDTTQTDGSMYIGKGGIAIDTIQTGGLIYIHPNGTLENAVISDGGTLIMSSGAILRGTLSLDGGASFNVSQGVIDAQGAEVHLQLSSLYTINNLAALDGVTLRVTVAEDQEFRSYRLAKNAWNYSGTVTVCLESGVCLDAMHVGDSLRVGNTRYSVNLDGSYLQLQLYDATLAPEINVEQSILPTQGPTEVIAEVTDNFGEVKLFYSMDGIDYFVIDEDGKYFVIDGDEYFVTGYLEEYDKGAFGKLILEDNGTVYFKAIDIDGNETVVSYTVSNIDKVAPVITLTADTMTPLRFATLFATVNEDVDIYWSYDGTWWNKYEDMLNTEDNCTFYFKATDLAGNVGTAQITFTNIDTVVPNISNIAADVTAPTNGKVIVTAVACDEENDVTLFYSKDGGEFVEYAECVEFTANGSVIFKAVDAAGNETVSDAFEVSNIDKFAPEISDIKADVTIPTNGKVVVTASANDDANAVSLFYSKDGGEFFEYTDGVEFTANGEVIFKAVDAAGNETVSEAFTVTNIDTTAPQITDISADVTTPTNGKVVVTVSASDDANAVSLFYSKDGGEFVAYHDGVEFTDNGDVVFKAVDAAGNETVSEAFEVTNIDKIAPVIELTGDTTSSLQSTKLTASTEAGVDIYWSTDNASWTKYEGELDVTANGTYYFKATDAAGNTGTEQITFANLDTGAPVITLTGDTTTPLQKSTLSAAVDDDVEIYWSMDNETWTKYEGPLDITANGTYYFKATDEAGNVGMNSIIFNNIDTVAPAIEFLADTATPLQSAKLTATTEAGLKLFYNMTSPDYSGDWTEYTGEISVTANGTYYFKATDAAGNTGTNSIIFTNIDTVAPSVSRVDISQPDENGIVTITVETTETLSKLEYSWKDGEWLDASDGTISVAENGSVTFHLTDLAGNETVTEAYVIEAFDILVTTIDTETTDDGTTFNWSDDATAAWSEEYDVVIGTAAGSIDLPGVAAEGVELLNAPSGEMAFSVKPRQSDIWTDAVGVNVENDHGAASQYIQAETNGLADVMFAIAPITWNGNYEAQHMGFGEWNGTGETAELAGKNTITDVFAGSDDASILLMTDDANGDALFIDDIYSAFPEGLDAQARIAKIDEIRAGDGNDIVDLTSQRFDYIGGGITVHGGLGDDVIWANNGDNTLFGDAGNDRLVGAGGSDVLIGGSGNDSLHGGGGEDIFAFGGNWGNDNVEQLSDGKVTLWFENGSLENWNAATLTYKDGENSVKVSGVTAENVTLKFGDDGSQQYSKLLDAGAFDEFSSERVFEDRNTRGMLA